MAHFTVTVQADMDGRLVSKDVSVDAVSVRGNSAWMIFSSNRVGGDRFTVAAFPTARVIGIVRNG